ncbi:MAG: glycosyltransferase family 2 protein [Patescibacteria group bacterium]
MKVSCVIPAWNEENNIVEVLEKLNSFVDQVVVVDDCSSDKTGEVARKFGAIVLRHQVNRGQGAALQTGNSFALKNGADIIVHFDADNQFSASEIPSVIAPLLSKEADIVFGSRFLGKKANLPFFKKNIIMPIAKLINHHIFKITLSDPQNGFRAMTRESAEKIIIENRGFAHNNEIQIKAFALNLIIAEVPITVTYHRFGQKFSGGIRILKDLLISKIIN